VFTLDAVKGIDGLSIRYAAEATYVKGDAESLALVMDRVTGSRCGGITQSADSVFWDAEGSVSFRVTDADGARWSYHSHLYYKGERLMAPYIARLA
jgi:hypothetical protein